MQIYRFQIQRMLVAVLGLIVVISLAWHSRVSADVVRQQEPPVLRKAERALQQGNVERALALVNARLTTVQSAAFEAQAHDLLCRAYFARGDYGRAEIACDTGLAVGGDAGAWSLINNRGVMRLMQGRYEYAIADFNEALKRNPRSDAARRNLHLAEEALDTQMLTSLQ